MNKILAILLALLPAVSLAQVQVPSNQREGAEHKKQADEFFESLHVVPPGMNWRIVNQHVRDARVARMLARKGESVQADTPRVSGLWREIGSINQAGRIVAVDFDEASDRVWVGGDGGTVWVGSTQGNSWKILNESQRISYPRLIKNIRMADGSERIVVVSNSPRSYILNEGDTLWSQAVGLEEMQRWGSFFRVVSCQRSGRLEIIGIGNEWDYGPEWRARGVVYRSVDSGASFTRIAFLDGVQTVWTDGGDNVKIIYGDTIAVFKSSGEIVPVSVLPKLNYVGQRLVAGQSAQQLMLALTDSDSTHFYISYDEGVTWEPRSGVGFGPFEQRSFCQVAGDDLTWLFGGVDVYRSDDEGYSWSPINTWGEYYADPLNKLHADIPSLSSLLKSDGSSLTFLCTDGGIYVSTDRGKTVRNIGLQNLNVSQYYGSYTSRDNVAVVSAGAQDQGFQRSTVDTAVAARAFIQLISGDYANLVSGDNGQSLFAVYPGFVLYNRQAELGWNAVGKDFAHKNQMWLPPLAVNKNKPEQVLLGGGTNSVGAFVYRYTDNRSELVVDSLPFDFGEGIADVRISTLAVSDADPRYQFVVTTNGLVWSSNDFGVSWKRYQRPDGLDGHYFSGNAIATDANTASRFYVGGSGYAGPGVYVSADAGASFSALDGLPPSLVMSLAITDDGRFLAAATDAGAFVYDTTTHVWTDITELGAPDQTYWDVDWVAPLRLFRFSTYGRGLWDFAPTFPTSVMHGSSGITQFNVQGIWKGQAAALKIESAVQTQATCVYYDVDGRRILSTEIQLSVGTQFVEVPSEARSATMAVLILRDGTVGASVIPMNH
ncbi:MAG: hypothetical protein HYX66_09235 [Ignavibacteria bacterium]|nr:hypothetical protein [Ignavibacteria bacterium]